MGAQTERISTARPSATRGLMDDPLRELPARYFEDGDLRHFMERASGWILDFCRYRLSRDPDLVGDFYVHFYERADLCLQKYRVRTYMPFTGYLATYLRREFFNFKRGRRSPVHEVNAPEIFGEEATSSLQYPARGEADPLSRSLQRIHELSLPARLPLKLYYGMNLDSAELRYIVEVHENPTSASAFLKEFHTRREKMRTRVRHLSDRAAHLSLLIHSADMEGDPVAADRRRRWKRNLERVQSRDLHLFSLSELAVLLRLSKSAVSRRIQRAIQSLALKENAI